MKSSRTYGDNHEIAALAKELLVNVRVLNLRKDGSENWVTVGPDRSDLPTLRVALRYNSSKSSRNHYMSLRPHETVNYGKITEVDGTVHKL